MKELDFCIKYCITVMILSFAWIGLEISTTTPFGDRESTTDNNYLVRTLQYETILPNSICKTEGKNTYYNNKRW